MNLVIVRKFLFNQLKIVSSDLKLGNRGTTIICSVTTSPYLRKRPTGIDYKDLLRLGHPGIRFLETEGSFLSSFIPVFFHSIEQWVFPVLFCKESSLRVFPLRARVFKKKRNVPIVMIANRLPKTMRRHGPFRARYFRLRFSSNKT